MKDLLPACECTDVLESMVVVRLGIFCVLMYTCLVMVHLIENCFIKIFWIIFATGDLNL